MSRRILVDYCPVCSAASWRAVRTRLFKAGFWGGVITLAFFLLFYFFGGEPHEDFTFLVGLAVMAGLWVAVTIILLLPSGGWYGDGGNGGWGNGGWGNGGD